MTTRAAGRAAPSRGEHQAAAPPSNGTAVNGSARPNGHRRAAAVGPEPARPEAVVSDAAPAEPVGAAFSTVAVDGASPNAPEALVLETTGVQRSPRTRVPVRTTGWGRKFQATLVVLDLLCCSLAGYVVINVYQQARAGFFNEQMLNVTALVLMPALWGLLLWAHGAYEGRYLGLGPDEFKRVVKAIISLTAIVCFLAFTRKADLSRAAVGTVLPLTVALTLGARFLARKVLHFVRRRGRAAQRILLVGTLGEALSVYRITTRNPHAGLAPVGICLTEATAETVSLPIPVFNGKVDPIERVQQIGADTVAVCGARGVSPDALRRLAWQLEGTGIDLVVAPALTNIAGPRVHIRPVEGLPLLHVEEPTISGVGWLFKGLLDRMSALFGLLILSPLLAAAAVAIRMTSPGPVFFRQERVGRGGETIRVWKFRTMYSDAEARLAELLGGNETDGLLFKMRDDPRITPVGHLLRKTSIDELPQLINVLLGEMSLVGPAAAARAERGLRRGRPPPPAGAAGHHRPLAGLRPVEPVLGGRRPARPVLRRQLVADVRLHDPVQDPVRGPQARRRLLGIAEYQADVHPRGAPLAYRGGMVNPYGDNQVSVSAGTAFKIGFFATFGAFFAWLLLSLIGGAVFLVLALLGVASGVGNTGG